MRKPKRRILYHTDGRHTHMYQLEPPLTLQQLLIPVDELLGTMVDTIVLSAGGGTTFFHATKAGTLWGELEEEVGKSVWRHLVWYRPAETVRQLLREGYDQMQVLADRAHEKGLEFIVSLWTNPPASNELGDGRLDRFRKTHLEYQIGGFQEGGAPAAAARSLDFSINEVREERLGIIREICSNYPIDGFELNMEFPYLAYYFKPGEAEGKSHVMTGFIRDTRRILDSSGEGLILAARTPPTIEGCRKLGLNIVDWVRDGLIDVLVPESDSMLIDVDLPVEEWVDAAKGTGCQVYPCISPLVNDDRRVAATVEMYRAAAMNYLSTGADGVYLVDFYSRGWPFNAEDYTVLREVGDIDAVRFKDKHYWMRTGKREADYIGYPRRLPLILEDTSENTVRFRVSEELESALKAGILKQVQLRLRIRNVTLHDHLGFSLNGEPLPDQLCVKMDFTYRLLSPARSVERRLGAHYVFKFNLTNGPFPVKGVNEVSIKVERRDPWIDPAAEGCKLELHDVELRVAYRIARNYPTFTEERDL